MKFGIGLRKGTYERLKMACGQDSAIIATKESLATHAGVEEQYLVDLGLTHGDLLRLERYGFAKRGYTKNHWGPGEETPDGRTVPEKQRFLGEGHKVKWVLLIPEVAPDA